MTDPTTHATGTIVVSGTGRVAVEPDVAELRLGVADRAADGRGGARRGRRGDDRRSWPRSTAPASPGATSGRRCCPSSHATTTATARRRR